MTEATRFDSIQVDFRAGMDTARRLNQSADELAALVREIDSMRDALGVAWRDAAGDMYLLALTSLRDDAMRIAQSIDSSGRHLAKVVKAWADAQERVAQDAASLPDGS